MIWIDPGSSFALCQSCVILCTVSVLGRLVLCVGPGSSGALCRSWIGMTMTANCANVDDVTKQSIG